MLRDGGEARCREVRGLLSEYIDKCLSSKAQGVVERHLELCEACARELESLRMMVQLLHRVPEVPAPRSFAIAGVESRREGILGPSSLRWLRPATAIAVVVLMVLLTGDLFHVFQREVGGGEVFSGPVGSSVSVLGGEGNMTEKGNITGVGVSGLTAPLPSVADGNRTEEGNATEIGGNILPGVTPEPTLEGAGNVTEGNASTEQARSGVYSPPGPPGGPLSIPGESPVSWPLRQIEIAMGVVVFALAAMTVFARMQRRKGANVR